MWLHAALLLGVLGRATTATAAPLGPRPASWPCTWAAPPKGTPSATWPDGPILGNGNIGVSLGGSDAGVVTAYMTVHGFWGINTGNRTSADPHGFPGCPAENCTVPVGMLIGGISFTAPDLAGGSWVASLWLDNATSTVTLTSTDGSATLSVTAWASATSEVVDFTLIAGGAAQGVRVNVTTWTNDGVLNVPVSAGCVNASTALPTPCPPPGGALAGAFVRKAATVVEGSPLLIDGAILWVPVSPVATTNTTPFALTLPAWYWATNVDVPTHTVGSTAYFTLPRGEVLDIAATAVASRDPGVYPGDVVEVAGSRLAGLASPSSSSSSPLPALYAAHCAWWNAFWSASGIALDPAQSSMEAFWYSALYALGSGSKVGQLVMDLWSPWRTTDAPDWRSNPTMDYNQEALYSGLFGANHGELAVPYYDFIDAQLAGGQPQAESAALGCPGGVHFSVDMADFGVKFGITGTPGNWGIFTNAAYAAMTYVYEYETSVLNATWVRSRAWPFMTAVATFWTCRLVRTPVPLTLNPDGYQWWDVDDCTGDEGCGLPPDARNNPMWGVVFIRRLLETLVSMGGAIGEPVPPAWTDILAHWPSIPVTMYAPPGGAPPLPVLAWYGRSNFTSFSKQANNLAALWPGELLSLSEPNGTLLAAAQNALAEQNWGQSNSFSWVYSAAARAGLPPDTIFTKWNEEAGKALSRPNRLVAFGGLCSDSLGAVAFVHDVLVQGQEGFLRMFPAWKGEEDASFFHLRMRGALLVSAAYVGQAGWAGQVAGMTGGTAWVGVTSEGGGGVTLLSPWPAAPPATVRVCDVTSTPGVQACDGLPPLPLTWSVVGGMHGGPALTWQAVQGHAYVVASTA